MTEVEEARARYRQRIADASPACTCKPRRLERNIAPRPANLARAY